MVELEKLVGGEGKASALSRYFFTTRTIPAFVARARRAKYGDDAIRFYLERFQKVGSSGVDGFLAPKRRKRT